MEKEQFIQLVHAYLHGNASAEEMEALERYYLLFADEPEILNLLDETALNMLEHKLHAGIQARIREADAPAPVHTHRRWYIRAAAAILLLGSIGIWWYSSNLFPQRVVQSADIRTSWGDKENRYSVLPDGTKVLLHRGSELHYTTDSGSRQVTLSGQAWFDVAQQAGKPFIIHTGSVTTTVLGTSFSIRAWPREKQVVVAVNSGKVQVSDALQNLAILTRDKQLVYDMVDKKPDKEPVKATESLAWAAQDMTFDNLPLSSLAEKLSRRYGIPIRLNNKKLEGCPITGRFSGTETLDEVLHILTATSQTTYKKSDKEVVIDGKGCF
ncbi:FecR family protein [bacterium A37T11]|nr:FecR family protein [bacterium A37T11]